MSSKVNGSDGVVAEKVAILDAGAQYGKVCWWLSYLLQSTVLFVVALCLLFL